MSPRALVGGGPLSEPASFASWYCGIDRRRHLVADASTSPSARPGEAGWRRPPLAVRAGTDRAQRRWPDPAKTRSRAGQGRAELVALKLPVAPGRPFGRPRCGKRPRLCANTVHCRIVLTGYPLGRAETTANLRGLGVRTESIPVGYTSTRCSARLREVHPPGRQMGAAPWRSGHTSWPAPSPCWCAGRTHRL